MKYDARRVLEILLDELAQVLRLAPEAVDRCRQRLEDALRPKWPVLFLATGDEPPSDAAIESFRALVALGVEPHLCRSRSFSQLWTTQVMQARLGPVKVLADPKPGEIPDLTERFPLLCVLALSENTVTKTVLGLRDARPPLVLRAFLERGRPVVVAAPPPQRLEVDRANAGAFWSLPLPMRQWLTDGYRTLEQWGVEFVEPEQLLRAIRKHLFDLPAASVVHLNGQKPPAQPGRAVVTRDDVRDARSRHEREISVSKNAIVTDEARELAERWGIVITRS